MTAVHPTRSRQDEDHLIAWTAGYLAASTAIGQAAYDVGFQRGHSDALLDVLTRMAELVQTNQHLWLQARQDAKNRAQQRRQAIEDHAQRLYQAQGRTEYCGGPVDWDTGKPVRHLRGVA